MKEVITLKNNERITFRLLQKEDGEQLFLYLNNLSEESKSRFGPHRFDRETVSYIVNEPTDDILRYIAVAADRQQEIVAYMLIKKGMLEGEPYRLRQNNIGFEEHLYCTYAPSVADAWQSTGLGSAMYQAIENDVRENTTCRFIILWGGVQATNAKAIGFYQKQGFRHLGSFWYDGKDNYDMVKSLY